MTSRFLANQMLPVPARSGGGDSIRADSLAGLDVAAPAADLSIVSANPGKLLYGGPG